MQTRALAATDHHVLAISHLEQAVDLTRARSGAQSSELGLLLPDYGQVKSEDDVDLALKILGEGRDILVFNHDKRADTAAAALMSSRGARSDMPTLASTQSCHSRTSTPIRHRSRSPLPSRRSPKRSPGQRVIARAIAGSRSSPRIERRHATGTGEGKTSVAEPQMNGV
jgi:hypothetical protein